MSTCASDSVLLTGWKVVGDDVRGDVSCEHLESGRPFLTLWSVLQDVIIKTRGSGVGIR